MEPHLTLLHGLELAGLMLLGMLAFTWAGVLFGMLVRSPDAVQGVGFTVVFPLTFLAGTFVPIAGMDAIPRAIAEWDPISVLVASVRDLTQGIQSRGSWPLDHPELAMFICSLVIIAVCVPLALRRFNRTLAAWRRAGQGARYGSINTPGLSAPPGSTAALAARSAAANGSGR